MKLSRSRTRRSLRKKYGKRSNRKHRTSRFDCRFSSSSRGNFLGRITGRRGLPQKPNKPIYDDDINDLFPKGANPYNVSNEVAAKHYAECLHKISPDDPHFQEKENKCAIFL